MGWLETSYLHPDQITPERWEKLMMTRQAYETMVRERAERDRGAPKVSERAPDFSAHRLAPDGSLTGERFQLSQALGRPMGLVLGSYT